MNFGSPKPPLQTQETRNREPAVVVRQQALKLPRKLDEQETAQASVKN